MAQVFDFPSVQSTSRLDWSNYPAIPDHTRGAIERYIFNRYEPGGFLMSVLSNDLMGAVARADSENVRAIKDICQFIYNEIPSTAWGSPKKVAEWLDNRA